MAKLDQENTEFKLTRVGTFLDPAEKFMYIRNAFDILFSILTL